MDPSMEYNLSLYKKEHQNVINEILHFFGISALLLSLFISIFLLTQFWGVIIGLIFGPLIILGGWRGLSAALYVFVIGILGTILLPSWLAISLLTLVGVTCLFVGHKIFEKNKPAVISNGLPAIVVAILWIGEVVVFYPLWHRNER